MQPEAYFGSVSAFIKMARFRSAEPSRYLCTGIMHPYLLKNKRQGNVVGTGNVKYGTAE
jgi:hypothetical protein